MRTLQSRFSPSRRSVLASLALAPALPALLPAASLAQAPPTPLPSWNEGPAKQAILDFVHATAQPGATFVPPEDRIATFDQDGTLWVEQPIYTQAVFALARLRALGPQHPEWKTKEPFRSILSGNKAAISRLSEKDWAEIIAVTHAAMSTEAFLQLVQQWIQTAKDPRFNKLYTQLVYQPMLEVMQYLRANGFRTYIVSGGGQEFIRAYSQRVYNVPPEQVIGSSIVTKYEIKDGVPILMRLPQTFFIDDGPGKPVGINLIIGKRPYAAFGNSAGDRQMLEWVGAGNGPRLKMLVHHDDSVREYAYGPAGGLPDSKTGTFPDSLMGEAKARNWTVISMKNDWNRVFSFT